MLVLTRKAGQSVMIGDEIEITILETKGDQIKLGINASKDIDIHRKEVYETIQQANRQAVHKLDNLPKFLK